MRPNANQMSTVQNPTHQINARNSPRGGQYKINLAAPPTPREGDGINGGNTLIIKPHQVKMRTYGMGSNQAQSPHPQGEGLVGQSAVTRNPKHGVVDPFAKINPKARKLIESMERNRQQNNLAVAERRTGSTGGTSTQTVDLTLADAATAKNSRGKAMNQTT
jgi:hypothetical protein